MDIDIKISHLFLSHIKAGERATYDAEPRENEVDDIVHRLHHEHELSRNAMAGPQHLPDMCDSVRGSEEGTVQPSATLRNELWKCVGHIGFSNGTFHIFEHPAVKQVRYPPDI
jgi:hypothetical protein